MQTKKVYNIIRAGIIILFLGVLIVKYTTSNDKEGNPPEEVRVAGVTHSEKTGVSAGYIQNRENYR